eukprot:352650-Chlamydomonas_euryale.AAC.2
MHTPSLPRFHTPHTLRTLARSTPPHPRFGSMGEHLVVSLGPREAMSRTVGLIGSGVKVQVTLRELRPLAGCGTKRDPFGQVNPLYGPPPKDALALVSPQKVWGRVGGRGVCTSFSDVDLLYMPSSLS